MSVTIKDIDGGLCVCGEILPTVHVDLIDCGDCAGLVLKQHGDHGSDYIDLNPKMVADLVDALIEWQNEN